ncbi:MAG TPA: SDR family NAD(P)-dependent oxidoreductase [Steroidobacteraceae bacterium]|jgi:NAD(P)-dependent dehydrogenase (short-subunit alcohol dehydrogenase family)|nr:SDR family NAD(P)-dependent oxidoreductase [Steroidobacteraceae bacterium]
MKTFLSIGSGPGLSFATAARFAREGFRITLSNRNAAKARELAERLNRNGYPAEGRTVDSGDPEGVASLIGDVERQFGTIDVLHYNTASMRKATLEEQPRNTFGEDLAVNIGGALVAVQTVAQQMAPRRSGTILLTGGGYSVTPNPQYISLSVGKAGIRALTLGMFDSLKQKGIHIATVTVEVALKEPRQAEAAGELFWQLHSQPINSWTAEVKYGG